MTDFSYFDIVVCILILLFGLKGVVNGFIREFFGLVGIVGGVYGASVYSNSVGSWISDNIYRFDNPSAISLIGFIVTLIVIWVTTLIVAEILQRIAVLSALSFVNRVFGFFFGAFKIFMIFSIIFYALSNFQLAQAFIDKYTKSSHVYPMLIKSGDAIVKIDIVDNLNKTGKDVISQVNIDSMS